MSLDGIARTYCCVSAMNVMSDSLRRALEAHEFEKSVLADEREAEALGVSGVPAARRGPEGCIERRAAFGKSQAVG